MSISNAFPDPVQHGREAIGRIRQEATSGPSRDFVSRVADGVTRGGFQAITELGRAALVDFTTLPLARLTGRALRSTVGFAIQYTTGLLRNLPIIPVMNNRTSLASVNDITSGRERLPFPVPPSLDALQRGRGFGRGQGQANGNPDAQPQVV